MTGHGLGAVLLAASMSLCCLVLPQAHADPGDGDGGRDRVVIIDERELLRRYLEEVARRTETEMQVELARLDYQREVFREYSARWWEQQNFERYWQAYYQGQEYAQSLLAGSGGSNSCKLIRETPSVDLRNPLLNEAFRRGMVSVAPDCFISALLDQLKATDRDVVALRARIMELRKGSMRNRPDPKDVGDLQDLLEQDLKRGVLSFAETQAGALRSAVSILPEDREALQRIVSLITMKIGCENVRDRAGRRFGCTVLEVPGVAVDSSAVLKVVFTGQQVGAYQDDLSFDRLFEAVDFYLREIRPGDPLVLSQMEQLKRRLELMDRTREARLSAFRAEFQGEFRKFIRRFSTHNRLSERLEFPEAVREEILDRFFLLREKLLSYERVELGTRAERTLMNRIIGAYHEALEMAYAIRNEFSVRSGAVVIQLDDAAMTRIQVLDAIPAIPGAILLGRDGVEADEWYGMLELNELNESEE